MEQEPMNQSTEMGHGKKGKAWGWVVLIIIILLVIWGLFALGDNNEDADVDDTTLENIEDELNDTDVDNDGVLDEIEAELDAGASGDTSTQ